jgi:hypothetical protein
MPIEQVSVEQVLLFKQISEDSKVKISDNEDIELVHILKVIKKNDL